MDDEKIKSYYKNITGNLPYSFQLETTKRLINKKNIILQAPTGAGKTWAALFPFLWAKKNNIKFVDRIIYVLPLRTLATSLFEDTVFACSTIFKVKTSAEDCIREENELVITIQTGEQKKDPFFEGDIIFTTVDQCLSAYLNMPVSLPKRLGNINAGALIGSLIVFDEFHLLEPDKSMGTAIEMLQRLKKLSQFIIMTATLSSSSTELLKEILGCEIIRLSSDDVIKLPSHKDKKRRYRWIPRHMSIDDILLHHNDQRTIVIVNTVIRAQDIFSKLKNKTSETAITVLLLHGRFYPEHRKNTENKLKDYFGKNATKTNVILVTTQVVEAGIDISADNLHTELAPLNSLVQRGGRCARYEGIRGVGTIWIYELKSGKTGYNTRPYNASIVLATRCAVENLPSEGKCLDFTDELDLLDSVHSETEYGFLKPYKNLHSIRSRVNQAMDGQNNNAVRELIRDVSSVSVIISNKPRFLDFNKEKWPAMLSVPRSGLYRLEEAFAESSGFGETVAWYPDENPNIVDDNEVSFAWKPISSIEDLSTISWLIVINPQYASYSSELGLQIGVTGESQETCYFERSPLPRFSIKFETYAEHTLRTFEVCKAMGCNYGVSEANLEQFYDCEDGFIESLAEIACILHDIGKLSSTWQDMVIKWQQFKNAHKLTGEPIAHSDFNPDTDFEARGKMPKQPSHAAEGAYAIADWLNNYIGSEYSAAVYTAIARHHGAFTSSLSDFRLIEQAAQYVMNAFHIVSATTVSLVDEPDHIARSSFKDNLLEFSCRQEDERLWPLYVFIVRRLRLADQKSQKGGDI
jgi:CRISPR-associated endonuclease/helicase Cas3